MQGDKKTGYNDTISKPSFLLKEKEKEVFLNGEVKELKKIVFGGQQKQIKKTMVCLKALQVEENLGREAVRAVMNKDTSFKFTGANR